MVIEFYATKMKNRGDKIPPNHCYKCDDCCHRYSTTQKVRKDLNEFVTKLHDIPSKVENIHVCLKKFVSDAIEEKVESVEAYEKNQILCQG